MSETPITQQVQAAAARANQLTERMLTAERNAGGGLADAHEKALRSLADNPADLNQPVAWVQALAEVHAKFIEEATDAAGAEAVDGYEKALQDMADFETTIAGRSQLDWLQAVARSHTKFVTDLVSMYGNAIKNGLSG